MRFPSRHDPGSADDLADRRGLAWFAALTTLLAAVALGWWLHAASVLPLWGGAAERARWTVTAPLPGEQAPQARSNELWVGRVFADGRVLRADEIQRTGRWELAGPAFRPVYAHRDDPEPATLSFEGRRVAVEFLASSWSGRARVAAGDTQIVVDCHAPSARPLWVDLPPASPPGSVFACCLGVVVWGLLRPWRSRRGTDRFLVAVLVLAHAAAAAALPIDTCTDSLDYLPCLRGNVLEGQPAYFPPGYGILQWLADAVPGVTLGTALVWMQHAAMVVALLATWRLASGFLGWCGGAVFLWLGTWSAAPLFTPQLAMSETMAFATMAFAVGLVDRFVRGAGGRANLVGAGLCLGLGTLARVVPAFAAGPAMLLLLLALPCRRAALRAAALAFGVAGAVVALPMAWFALQGHGFTLSTGVGRHLYNRIVHEQGLLAPEGPATRRVRELLPDADLTRTLHWDLATALHRQVPPAETEALIAAVASEALRAHPVDYLLYTGPHAWRNLVASPSQHLLGGGFTERPELEFEAEPLLGVGAAAMTTAVAWNGVHRRAWPWCCWAAALALLLVPFCRSPRRALAVAWLPVGYLVATSFVEFHLSRYNLAVAPFVLAIALLPFGLRRGRG